MPLTSMPMFDRVPDGRLDPPVEPEWATIEEDAWQAAGGEVESALRDLRTALDEVTVVCERHGVCVDDCELANDIQVALDSLPAETTLRRYDAGNPVYEAIMQILEGRT